MPTFPDFQTEWLGNKVADSLLAGDHPYQCVSFVKQYLRECFNIEAGWWGNAIDYWYKTNPAMLTKFSREATQNVQQGDIVILETNVSPIQPGLQPGHIGLATGNQNGLQFELLEQNGQTGNGLANNPGDLIRLRWVGKSRIAGVIRPLPAPAPNPQPVCTYEDTDPHTMQVKLQPTNWWNLNVFSGDINDFKPAAFLDKGTHFLIGGYGVNKHFPNYRYAMSPDDFARAVNGDYSTNNGVNVLDLEEIPAPVPEPIPVYTPPAGAITVPITMNMLKIVTTIMTWPSATDAANRTKAATTIPPGDYQVLKTGMNQMLYVTKPNDPNKRKFWINPQDNTTEKPTPLVDKQVEDMAANAWKKLTPLHPNGKPEQFVMLRSFEVTDLANPKNPPHSFPQYYEKVWVYGTFNKDGITYAALHRSDDPAWTQRYAIPWKNEDGSDTGIIEAYQVVYSPEVDEYTKIQTKRKNGQPLTPHQMKIVAVVNIEKYLKPAVQVIDGIFAKKRPKKPLK